MRKPKNEVGGQRGTVSCSDFPGLPESIWGTVLFQPPLPKPDRHLSAHPALQPIRVQLRSMDLDLRISRPRHSVASGIPTCLASPCTGLRFHRRGLLPRLCRHRLAPLGDPAFRHVCTYRARRRFPTHSFEPVSLPGIQVAEGAAITRPHGGTTMASLL